MDVAWILSPYSLTLDELYAQDPPYSFLHNDIIYIGILRCELTQEGIRYVVVTRGADAPSTLLGSTVVTPVRPVQPNPIWPTPSRDSSPPPR